MLRGAWSWMATAVLAAGFTIAAMAQVPAYDVVSVKPNKTGSGSTQINWGSDKFSGNNITLKMLLRFAYDLTTEDQIAGISGWAEGSHWDIEAKVDAETLGALKKLSREDSSAQQRAMMQGMLEDRFKLKIHHEQRELGMYDLVVAKGGSKLTPAAAIEGSDGKTQPKDSMMVRNGQLTAEGVSMSRMAGFLSQTLHKQVADKTGLTGNYDISLKWQRDDMPESKEATGAEQAPSIFTAVQEQLGLKLDATKGLVDMIVVDHVEMPSEN